MQLQLAGEREKRKTGERGGRKAEGETFSFFDNFLEWFWKFCWLFHARVIAFEKESVVIRNLLRELVSSTPIEKFCSLFTSFKFFYGRLLFVSKKRIYPIPTLLFFFLHKFCISRGKSPKALERKRNCRLWKLVLGQRSNDEKRRGNRRGDKKKDGRFNNGNSICLKLNRKCNYWKETEYQISLRKKDRRRRRKKDRQTGR